MNNLFVQTDGANAQPQAVLAYLREYGGIEKSWSSERGKYVAEPSVSRWENCREQGYVVWMRSSDYKRQINIAFFEHRNSDQICAVKWEQITRNAPTIDTAEFGDVYKDKYDVSHSFSYGKAAEMAEWVFNALSEFWADSEK